MLILCESCTIFQCAHKLKPNTMVSKAGYKRQMARYLKYAGGKTAIFYYIIL
ncbi:hypothetical protein B7P43_G02618 [Cryptotermes secundus]|uniref:Uncharacterized protein n=1 Tax=Cryptotermes secundus TaxID=105785 RepID=A0A2J7PP46_9NEOP|nr:hypothetical protein B7P43_G02618 [Cryptotermes secundus]